MSDKTEQPTSKRLRKAREDGDSGASGYAAQAVAFLVAIPLLPGLVRAITQRTTFDLRANFELIAARSTAAGPDAAHLSALVLSLVVPLLFAVAITSAVVQLAQTGGFIATGKLSPRLDRLNVFEGFKNLVSWTRIFSVVRAFVGSLGVAWIAYLLLRDHAVDLARSSGRLPVATVVAGELARRLALMAAVAGVAIGAIDVLVVRRGWMKRLMMTKAEVKREHRESEGDPHLKAARDRTHREMLNSATLASVRTASVVVVNPTHLACALRYESGEDEGAPVVVASGEGELALGILKAAQQFGVPVVRDVPLARALRELEVGDEIPEALFEAVAEILREVWEAK